MSLEDYLRCGYHKQRYRLQYRGKFTRGHWNFRFWLIIHQRYVCHGVLEINDGERSL